jgi:hypothetical protein
MNRCCTSLALLHEDINAAGSQSQKSDFSGSEERRQQQKQGQQWQPHQSKEVGVARIELALGEL